MKKRKFKLNRILSIIVALSAASMIFLAGQVTLKHKASGGEGFLQATVGQQEESLKMESVLSQLMEVYLAQGIEEARRFAQQRGIDMEGDSVRVVAEAASTGIPERAGRAIYGRNLRFQKVPKKRESFESSQSSLVSMQIEAYGGKVEMTHRRLVQSVVPLSSLQDLAHLPSIRYLRLPMKPVPFVTSEGVEKTAADQWQAVIPYRPTGRVKVCVLDLGFSGYEGLLGTELPSSVTVRSFRADLNINASDHGTACAEVVHDMAPDAELLLVNFGTDVEHHNAVNWIIDQGVDIISCSVGWFNMGAGDGTGPVCEDVKKAFDEGIIWVQAAGNSAERHWENPFSDPDSDQWCNFENPGQPEEEWFEFSVNAGDSYSILLNWDDWGAWDGSRYINLEGNDYDLFLYDSALVPIAWSMNQQVYPDGTPTGVPPVEAVTDQPTSSGLRYIRINNWRTIRDCKLELFFLGANPLDPQHQKLAGSLSIPADSPLAVSVGATNLADDSCAIYSSRGPTTDNRIKPDLAAPTGVSCVTYGNLGFSGTSASVPHVAGAFALLKGKLPYSLDQIRTILEARAKDLGASGKDNLFGFGRLNLSKDSQNGSRLRQGERRGAKSSASFRNLKTEKSRIHSNKKDST